MGVQAIVVGAGIAGLAAAIALNKAGHDVVVYERSNFKNEVGAAITITSNGLRVLDSWGFDFKAAGAVVALRLEMMDGKTLKTVFNEPFDDVESQFGYPVHFYHRVDLHRELRKLAESLGVLIHLGNPVEDVDEEGAVKIGEQWVSADLIVIADGVYSRHISKITGKPEVLHKIGRSVVRGLLPLDKVESDPELATFFSQQPPRLLMTGTPPPDATQIITYACRESQVLNVALVHNTLPGHEDKEGWHEPVGFGEIMEVVKDFHPAAHKLLSMVNDTAVHKISRRDPLPRVTKNRLVTIGDAAHVMPPTHAQGAVISIEEAGALEVFLRGSQPSEVPQRLEQYNRLMSPRGQTVQLLSESMPGLNGPPRKQAEKVWEEGGHGKLFPYDARYVSEPIREFFFGYNVKSEAEKLMQQTVAG